MLLYVTRHGETEYNIFKRYCGSTDIPLNDTGIAQAHDLKERLQGMKFDAVVSSPMLRARQYCEIIYNGLIMFDDRLTEIDCGEFEGVEKQRKP